MKHIVIGIATYQRPLMFSKALDSLCGLILPEKAFVSCIISDNDPHNCSKDIFRKKREKLPCETHYFSELNRGIVPNRNRILEEATTINANYVAFFDDDEIVDPHWLIALMQASYEFKSEAVWGKTVYKLPENSPNWLFLRNFYGGDQPKTGTKRRGASTNNVLIDLDFLNKHRLRFDQRFNDIGGSDSFLFRQVIDNGGKVISCREAITYEEVPETRTTEQWILRRAYKNAHTEYRRTLIRKGKAVAVLLCLFYGTWLISTFCLSLLAYPFKTYDFIVFNRRRVSKVKGLMHSLQGKSHDEYEIVHGT